MTTRRGRRVMVRPPLYTSWMMMRRCCGFVRGLTPYQMSHYVGISMSPEWHDYKTFEKWGLSHGWRKGLRLTRRNKDKDFEPGNCFFASIQVANGYRRCVRRLPDGRSARDLMGREADGRDGRMQGRIAYRLFGEKRNGYMSRWNPVDAVLVPKCRSRIDAKAARDRLAPRGAEKLNQKFNQGHLRGASSPRRSTSRGTGTRRSRKTDRVEDTLPLATSASTSCQTGKEQT